MPKNRCRKKGHPPQKLVPISGSGGSLTAPLARQVLNKRQQFEQQQQQQQQQLQQLWLNVDFCFENCPIWVETRKKGC